MTAAAHVTGGGRALRRRATVPGVCPELAMASGSGVGAAAGTALGAGVTLGVGPRSLPLLVPGLAGPGAGPCRAALGAAARPRDEGCGGAGGAAVCGMGGGSSCSFAACGRWEVGVLLRRSGTFRAGSGVAPARQRSGGVAVPGGV